MTSTGTVRPAGSAAMRTGAEYLRSLDDGRQVFFEGERIGRVIEHPAFRAAANSIAKLFDVAAASERASNDGSDRVPGRVGALTEGIDRSFHLRRPRRGRMGRRSSFRRSIAMTDASTSNADADW